MSDQLPRDMLSSRDVSVVIPVYRAGAAMVRCLEHLAATDPPPGEVIVVADGPGDRSWAVAGKYGARILESPERCGAGVARNAGARMAMGSVLFFVDADVAVAPDAVGQVVAAMNAHPEWSAVFGSYDDAPAATNFIAQYKGLLNHYVHQNAPEEAFTFWTALGAIRKDVFIASGGFDPACRLEDVELGYRLRAAAHRVGIRKNLLAKHLKRWTALSLLRSDFFDRAMPWTEIMLRHPSAEKGLNLDTASRLSVVCVFGLLLALGGAARWPAIGLPVAAALAAALLLLNRLLYAFFWRRRSLAFLLGAIAWHWLYFFYGGIAFGLGMLRHFTRRPIAAPAPSAFKQAEATS